VDWYIYLENGYVLAVMTDYGNGQIYYKVSKLIGAMLESIEYVEKDLDFREDYEAVLSEIFEHILVENRGMEMLDKLPDRLIFETDAIGVGTGPVDYYYSGLVDYTFKYEREADVILDKREGKSSAF